MLPDTANPVTKSENRCWPVVRVERQIKAPQKRNTKRKKPGLFHQTIPTNVDKATCKLGIQLAGVSKKYTTLNSSHA